MKECKKCKKLFLPTNGLLNYCSLQCRNSRTWTVEDKIKKSKSKNKTYVVTFSKISKQISCGCTGFGYRMTCSHVKAVSNKLGV